MPARKMNAVGSGKEHSGLEAGPGEVIEVSAGSAARYHAPQYARLIYAYGPSPGGEPSKVMSALPADH